MSALALALMVAVATDPLAAGRHALHELDYEAAVNALVPIASDDALDDRTRARAFLLLAEARFGIAAPDADARARADFRAALALDDDVDLERRADASPRLLALFDSLRPPRAKSVTRAARSLAPDSSPPPSPPQASATHTSAAPDAVAHAEIEPPTDPHAVGAPLSPWWIGSAGLAATAVVAGGVAGAIELYLNDVPARTEASSVRGAQQAGVAAVVVAALAGAAALGTSAMALMESP